MRLSSFSILILLAACNGDDDTADSSGIDSGEDTDTGSTDTDTADVDADGDGFLASEDCDDNDASAFPGGVERCDGADNDCDPATSEADMATWQPADGSDATDIASELSTGTAEAPVEWTAPASGTLSLCGSTYHAQLTASPGQEVTVRSGSSSAKARIEHSLVPVISSGATSLQLVDLELAGDRCLVTRCEPDACGESGDGGTATAVILEGVTADDCSVSSDNRAATLAITGSDFTGVDRTTTDAALSGVWASASIDSTHIDSFASGVDLNLTGDLSFTNSSIRNSNQPSHHGAAMRLEGDEASSITLDLTGSVFEDNVADGRRYALYVNDFAAVDLIGGTFTNNDVEYAAISLSTLGGSVDGTTVTDHSVRALTGGELSSLTNLTITDNGGGIGLGTDDGTDMITVSSSVIQRNDGRAIEVYSNPLTITDVDFGTGGDANTETDLRYESNDYDFEGVASASCSNFACE